MDIIKCYDVFKAFGEQNVLNGVNLNIPRGKITVVMGASGGGKSVFLKHLIGLLKPDQGRILIDGNDITRLSRPGLMEIRSRFGVLFQGGALFDSMNVYDNIAFPLREKTTLSLKQISDKVEELLEQLKLTGMGDKFSAEISGGMKKRVALARALITDPEIIFFDEPVAGLDPIMMWNIFGLIKSTHEHKKYTAVIVSHDIPHIFSIAEYVAMLHKGKIVACGQPDEVISSPLKEVQSFINAEKWHNNQVEYEKI